MNVRVSIPTGNLGSFAIHDLGVVKNSWSTVVNSVIANFCHPIIRHTRRHQLRCRSRHVHGYKMPMWGLMQVGFLKHLGRASKVCPCCIPDSSYNNVGFYQFDSSASIFDHFEVALNEEIKSK